MQYFVNAIEGTWIKEKYNEDDIRNSKPYLDLFITPNCNQACSYCYLHKYKNELYPKDIRNNQTILNNIDIYFNYLIEKKCNYLPRLDLFSGEIWGWPLGNEVFNIILKYLKQNLLHIKQIIIPSNCSFCCDKKLLKIIDYYISEFKQYNTNLIFSISMDGYIVDKNSRPLINNIKTEEYYDNIFNFAKQYDFGFHPMITPETIHLQKENYDFWNLKLQEYFPNNEVINYSRIMQLEIREGSWTREKIIEYIKWLNHIFLVDKKIYFKDNNNLMLKYLLHENDEHYDSFLFKRAYVPYQIVYNEDKKLGCGLGNSLQIRTGDLAIIPCHRTSYDNFIFGHYILDKNKIVGMESKNIPLLNAIYKTSFSAKPYCDNCFLNKHCLKYCLGANYENSGELFYPIIENCNLQKAKNAYICIKYIEMGIHDIQISNMNYKNTIENSIRNLIRQKEIKEWIQIIQEII